MEDELPTPVVPMLISDSSPEGVRLPGVSVAPPEDSDSELEDETESHPLISEGLPGCPYRMTSYRKQDIAEVDPAFGVQLHHPRFLECIGAPESAHLLGRSPAEWIRSIDKQDAISAALQLQHDAGLMASNLQVLGQIRDVSQLYVIGSHEVGIRAEDIPRRGDRRRSPGTSCSRKHTHRLIP